MPTFEVFKRGDSYRPRGCTVTLTKRGVISLSAEALRALGDPKAVQLLFDREAKILGLRPVERSGDATSFSVRGTGIVSGRAFLNFYGIALPESRRWPGEVVDGVLHADLRAPYDVVTSNRAKAK